jgi:uncharacterized protein (TIGR02996 family)
LKDRILGFEICVYLRNLRIQIFALLFFVSVSRDVFMPPNSALPQPAAMLPGEFALLASVVANLSDDTAKLVYADWLEEHDDQRGKLLRECVTAFRAGKGLPAISGSPKPWRELVGLTLMRRLRKAKLTACADTFLRLARPALRFKSARANEAAQDIGASKLGGRPDMPPDVKWPIFRTEPLAFLGQFNLASLAVSLVSRELPDSGVLSVFYLVDEDYERASDPKGSFRVFHFPDVSKLARRELQEELRDAERFKPCRLTFTEILTLPDVDSPWEKDLGFRNDEQAQYEGNVLGAIDEDAGLGHCLLGYPCPLQNDPLHKKTMRHLLTIDSDDGRGGPGWMWGDSGLLYFTIAEEDFQKRHFDKVRCEMQCC